MALLLDVEVLLGAARSRKQRIASRARDPRAAWSTGSRLRPCVRNLSGGVLVRPSIRARGHETDVRDKAGQQAETQSRTCGC